VPPKEIEKRPESLVHISVARPQLPHESHHNVRRITVEDRANGAILVKGSNPLKCGGAKVLQMTTDAKTTIGMIPLAICWLYKSIIPLICLSGIMLPHR
jgi:hypothetical protein